MSETDSATAPHLVARARAFLARGEPASAETIAREVLGIHGATPVVAARLVSSLLHGVAGFTRERGDIWRFVSRNSLIAESGDSGQAPGRPELLVAGGYATRDPQGAIQRIELAAGAFHPGAGAGTLEVFRFGPGAAGAGGDGQDRDPGEDDAAGDRRDEGSSLQRFAALLRGATVVAYRPRELLDPVIDRMLREHGVSPEVDTLSLARLARRVAPDLAHHSLDELAGRLDLPHYTSARGEDQARLAGLVLAALLARSGFAGTVTAEALLELEAGASGERDFERFAFDESWLLELPETPGIYRMFDAAGDLIYVGKAASLRRRLLQYFRNTGAPDERVERILAELHRIEIEETGSELAALLAEEREIRESAPRLNVQREVLPRSHRPARARNLALIANGAAPETAAAFFYQPPHPVVQIQLPLAGPLDAAARGAILALLARRPDAAADPARSTAETPGERGALEIVRSWIHLRRDESIVVDLEAAAHHDDAIRRIEDARATLRDREVAEHR